MSWEPTEEEIEGKLIEMAYVWGDIEERIELAASEVEGNPLLEEQMLAEAVGKAFRVEAVFDRNGFGDPCSAYALLFDVADREARRAVDSINRFDLRKLLSAQINDMARPFHSRDHLQVRLLPRSTPVSGEICRRLGEEHPPRAHPSLDDVPTFAPTGTTVPLERRGPYYLTPIEAVFFDALAETPLTFSVQPWIQHADRKYRTDFLIFYDGGGIAVELDGHEYHKTKEQRGADATKDRWLQSRGIRTVRFTGSQVYADVNGCIRELLDVVRQSSSRP